MGASVLRPNCLPIEGLALFAGQPETSFLPFGGMQKGKARFRRPTADEQTVLLGMSVKLLVRAQDIRKCDQLLIDHHYLHSAQLVGEQLRYAVYGPALDVRTLADLLKRAGCVSAMQLDINPDWMSFMYYLPKHHPGDPSPVNLLPD